MASIHDHLPRSRTVATRVAELGFACLAVVVLNACEREFPVQDSEEDLRWELAADAICPRLSVSPNGRHLVDAKGDPFFLMGDTAWALGWKLSRTDVDDYLEDRAERGFNAVGMVAYSPWHIGPNIYGDFPFRVVDGDWDHGRPLETVGSSPLREDEYDYWDHLEYVLARACDHGLVVLLNPTYGDFISGSWDGDDESRIYFDEERAYRHGFRFGERFGHFQHVIWMLGGDRNVVYAGRDKSSVYRALAEGISDGISGDFGHDGKADHSNALMSYWPRKTTARRSGPNSSTWFHEDEWLDFNSIQDWAWDQENSIAHDWALEPPKPTWLYEGRYEAYNEYWGAHQARYQAYQSVFAGGFGHLFGNEVTYKFGREWSPASDDREVWTESSTSVGTLDMAHLQELMATLSPEQLASRVSGQDILDGDQGQTGSLTSTRIVATRGAGRDYAMIYTAIGRPVTVHMDRLLGPTMDATWYDPRTGEWLGPDGPTSEQAAYREAIPSGPGGTLVTFTPPGTPGPDNDWVLVIRSEIETTAGR